jgi:hypothetical protein
MAGEIQYQWMLRQPFLYAVGETEIDPHDVKSQLATLVSSAS